MKITAYELRKDEEQAFKQLAKDLAIEIIYFPFALNEDTVHLAKGSSGVTILGSIVNATVLAALKESRDKLYCNKDSRL